MWRERCRTVYGYGRTIYHHKIEAEWAPLCKHKTLTLMWPKGQDAKFEIF